MSRLLIIAAAGATLAGCASTTQAPQPPPISCKAGPDCDAKWSRAVAIMHLTNNLDRSNNEPALTAHADEAGAPVEIEVTEEMIEAGVDAYSGYFLSLAHGDPETDRSMVCDVFRSMLASRPCCS